MTFLADILREAWLGISERPLRSCLTSLGTLAGIATLVTASGLSGTTNQHVAGRFDALAATEVVLEATPTAASPRPFGDKSSARLSRITGVRASGETWHLDPDRVQVNNSVHSDGPLPLPVVPLDPSVWPVLHGSMSAGRFFDDFHAQRAEQVVVLGRAAAHQLNIADLSGSPAVTIGGRPFAVIGIIADVKRHADLLLAAMIPAPTARRLWPDFDEGPHQIYVETEPGAARIVGDQAAFAVRPSAPTDIRALVPTDPRSLQNAVSSDLRMLAVALASISLLIGMLGIANVSLVSVLERVPEIGLRRALGASGRGVAAQFLLESALLGRAGGIAGSALGGIIVVAVAAVRHWTAVGDPRLILGSPLLGAFTGAVAGVFPARRASKIQPVDALRR